MATSAVPGRDMIDALVVDPNISFARVLQSGDHAAAWLTLPHPEGPTRTRNSPSSMSRLIPSTAR